MRLKANDEFSKWAVGYSGCDGGNLKGSMWFCGIEYGGGDSPESLSFEINEQVPFVESTYRNQFRKFQYNWKLIKLYASIIGGCPSEYKNIYRISELFSESSDAFKLNLYPIAFRNELNELWELWHFERTGFPTKELYRAWCQLERFEAIRGWVKTHNPKAIICTGSTYFREYFMAFGEYDVFKEYQSNEVQGIKLIHKKVNQEKTLLFVIPFLGQGGLKSDHQLFAIGKKINKICSEAFGENWCKRWPDYI